MVDPLEWSGSDQVRDRVTGETVSLTGRVLVLAYGSNANPQKLSEQFPDSDVLALPADVEGWAAVWCSQRRRSGEVVCTLAPLPGARERHVVLAVTPAQLARMDGWEGHPRWYRRERFTGRVTLSNGSSPPVQVYLGTPDRRPPLMKGGHLFRLSEVSYGEVDQRIPGRA